MRDNTVKDAAWLVVYEANKRMEDSWVRWMLCPPHTLEFWIAKGVHQLEVIRAQKAKEVYETA